MNQQVKQAFRFVAFFVALIWSLAARADGATTGYVSSVYPGFNGCVYAFITPGPNQPTQTSSTWYAVDPLVINAQMAARFAAYSAAWYANMETYTMNQMVAKLQQYQVTQQPVTVYWWTSGNYCGGVAITAII